MPDSITEQKIATRHKMITTFYKQECDICKLVRTAYFQ